MLKYFQSYSLEDLPASKIFLKSPSMGFVYLLGNLMLTFAIISPKVSNYPLTGIPSFFNLIYSPS